MIAYTHRFSKTNTKIIQSDVLNLRTLTKNSIEQMNENEKNSEEKTQINKNKMHGI